MVPRKNTGERNEESIFLNESKIKKFREQLNKIPKNSYEF